MGNIAAQASIIENALPFKEKDIVDLIRSDLHDARRVGNYDRICQAADDLKFIFDNTENDAIRAEALQLFDEAFDPTPELDHA